MTERFQLPWPEAIERIKRSVGSTTSTLVDSTGVGDPIVDMLQKFSKMVEGYKFNMMSKHKLMEGLGVAIQSKQLTYPDGQIVLELEQFEYEYTRTGVRYTAPEGFHDDCVCSLALAQMCRSTASSYDSTMRWVATKEEMKRQKVPPAPVWPP